MNKERLKELWSGRNLWRALTVAAIVFAAGISGSWLGEQMRDPLPVWWGWFGAIIAGFAVFGGVTLAVKGDGMGYAIIAAGGIADAALSVAYFGEAHAWYLALALGIYPTAVAVLGGIVEGRAQVGEQQAKLDAEERTWERERQEKQEAWEREQEEKREERLAEERRERMKLNAQITESVKLAEVQARANVHPNGDVHPERSPNGHLNGSVRPERSERSPAELKNDLLNYLSEHPNASLNEAATEIGRGKTTVHGYVQELQEAGRLARTGNGWEVTR